MEDSFSAQGEVDTVEYRTLGLTQIEVSRLCFGALTIGPLQRRMSVADGAHVIRSALDAGVRFIDTAELYGTYEQIRVALRTAPHDVVIATKSYAYERQGVEASLKAAREGMGRSVIDIFLLHEQESMHTLRGHWEALEGLLEAKQKGDIRAVGISTHHVEAVKVAAVLPEIDIISPLINVQGIGIQGGSLRDMEDAVTEAVGQGKGVYAMKPLGGGHLIPRWNEAFSYLLDQLNLDAIAVGMKNASEVRRNVEFFSGSRSSAWSALEESRQLHIDDWCSGCGKCAAVCSSRALSIVDAQAVVDPERCVFCGYCGAACPEFAIKVI